MIVKKQIEKLLAVAFEKCGYNKELAFATFSNKPELADFQCNSAFALAKAFSKNPKEICENIIANLEKSEDYIFSFAPPAFINIKLTDSGFSKFANTALNDNRLTVEGLNENKLILLDYGGANVAKELHMGHLRSPIIGESLKRLYRLLGQRVISDSHLGDWGLQMGLTIAQLDEDGVLDYYFNKSDKKPTITLDMLNVAYPKASARKKVDEAFKAKADKYTLYVQGHVSPYYEIYSEIREASVKIIDQNYRALNSFYDYWYGESTAEPYIERTIQILKDKGLTRVSDNALVVDVAREGEHIPIPKKNPDDENEEQLYENPMPPAIIKKFNGGDLYATTDIATILMRNEMDNPDEIHYVVDKRQALHFEQVFRCCKMSGISGEKQRLLHIGFGTMNGKDGKPFKTRDGGILKLEDVINMLKEKANEKLKQNGIMNNEELALQIGVASMKFGDLSNQVNKDYVLDIDKFCEFTGKTGPYLQYTGARIKSLLSKANNVYGEIIVSKQEEKEIIINLMKLIDSYDQCYKEHSLNCLCIAIYNLSSSFSTFYNNIKVLSEQDEVKRLSYLGLCKLVLKAIEQALDILAIEVPDRM